VNPFCVVIKGWLIKGKSINYFCVYNIIQLISSFAWLQAFIIYGISLQAGIFVTAFTQKYYDSSNLIITFGAFLNKKDNLDYGKRSV